MMSSSLRFFAFVVLGLLAGRLSGEEPFNEPPMVELGRFPLPMLGSQIMARSGTPADKAELITPFPNDFPPYTQIAFEDARAYPAFKEGARYFAPAQNRVVVYRITEVERAPYKTIQHDLKQLKELLEKRPKEVPLGEHRQSLPDYPPRNAGHFLHAKLTYTDFKWGSGIFYLTQFTQEAEFDFANNEELVCVFQGISKDGHFYVSMDIRVTHPKLPAGIDNRPKKLEGKDAADAAFLNKQADDSFTPSLKKVREWVGALRVDKWDEE